MASIGYHQMGHCCTTMYRRHHLFILPAGSKQLHFFWYKKAAGKGELLPIAR
jgi:hypothetical protein